MDKIHTYINTFKQKITPIFIINLIGILFLYLIIINTQEYTSLTGHDFIYPWRNLHLRLPAQVFETVFNNFLPSIFNTHPADMRTGFGLCNLILSFFALFICLLLTKAFFLYEGKKMVFRKEFLIILPLAFLSVFNPISFEYQFILFFRMQDLAVAGEYFFVLIPFFLSLIILYRIIFRNYQPSKFGNILYLVIFFVLGCYNELTNLTFLFFLIIFLSSLFVTDKEKLKNKNLYKMLIAFFAGIIYFYLVSNQLSADLKTYNFDFKTLLKMLNINKFLHEFFIFMFAKKYLFFIVYTLLITITILLQKDKETKLTVCYSAAIILGYLLSNLTTIFVMGMNNEEYVFEREFFNQLYWNNLTFAFLVCLGTLYKNIQSKKYIICFILIIIFSVIPCYTDKKKVVQRQQINQKILLYNIDKINLVYSTLGEISILPESYQNKHRSLDKTLVTDTFMKHQPQIITNQYYLHGFYGLYFETVYKKVLKGVRFEPDETAYQELES